MRLNTIERKRFRVRRKLKKVSKDRYRLSVSRSTKNISAQIIDDIKMYHHIKSSFMSLFNRKTYNFLISHKAKIDERKNKLC